MKANTHTCRKNTSHSHQNKRQHSPHSCLSVSPLLWTLCCSLWQRSSCRLSCNLNLNPPAVNPCGISLESWREILQLSIWLRNDQRWRGRQTESVRGRDSGRGERGVGALEGLTSVPPFFFLSPFHYPVSLFLLSTESAHLSMGSCFTSLQLWCSLFVTLKLHKGNKDVEYIWIQSVWALTQKKNTVLTNQVFQHNCGLCSAGESKR